MWIFQQALFQPSLLVSYGISTVKSRKKTPLAMHIRWWVATWITITTWPEPLLPILFQFGQSQGISKTVCGWTFGQSFYYSVRPSWSRPPTEAIKRDSERPTSDPKWNILWSMAGNSHHPSWINQPPCHVRKENHGKPMFLHQKAYQGGNPTT